MLEDRVADVLAYCKENDLLLTTAESCTSRSKVRVLLGGWRKYGSAATRLCTACRYELAFNLTLVPEQSRTGISLHN